MAHNIARVITIILTTCAFILTLLSLPNGFTGYIIGGSSFDDLSALVFFISGLFGMAILLRYE